MHILYTTRTIFGSLYLASDGFYEGCPLNIVLAMKCTAVFGERTPLDQYVAFHRDRLKRLHRMDIPLIGDTPQALVTSFLHALITLGVVARWRDDTPEGDQP
ncbi:MAG: hypothetical protein ACYC7E_04825 [Armatimonadota bacterium]